MARHNKKRNVGLIYEQLVNRLSSAIVENDEKTVATVNNIISSRFKKGTELYKEFRLFNALVQTSGLTEQLAFRILDEAKKASQDHDAKQLTREKSMLIKDINYNLNESGFYNTKVENYQVLASAQQLFNLWRSDSNDVSDISLHESTIHGWLTRDTEQSTIEEQKTQSVNDLTVKIMQEKLQAKYGNAFSDRQSRIIKLYSEGNAEKLINEAEDVYNDVKRLTKKYKKTSVDKFLLEQVTKAESVITETKFTPDTDSVAKVMLLDQLVNELEGMTNV